MCKLLFLLTVILMSNCWAGMQTENPGIDPVNPSFTSITFPDGTVQVSSPSAGGGGWVGTATSDLTMGGYDLLGGGTVQAVTRLETNRIVPYSGNTIGMFDALNKGFGIFSTANPSPKDCLAIMPGATASWNDSIAMGRNSQTSGSDSIAIGRSASASGADGIAIGRGANASGGDSIAIGRSASADRPNSIAIGFKASATSPTGNDPNVISIGIYCLNETTNSVALGVGNSGTYKRNLLVVEATTYIYTSFVPDFTYANQINLGQQTAPFDILYIETITYCSLQGYKVEKSISEDFDKMVTAIRNNRKSELPSKIYVPKGEDRIETVITNEFKVTDTPYIKKNILRKFKDKITGQNMQEVEITYKSREGQNLNQMLSLMLEKIAEQEQRIKVLEAK